MGITYSVVIVTYNHEKYIEKAIDSVIHQITDEEFEILIGDDGSQDRTIEILDDYKNKYEFIRVFAHSNVGLSQNVYELFINAKGKYIAILEGDDYWTDNEKLDKQRSIIESNNCIATACNSIKVDENGNVIGLWNERVKSGFISKADVLKYQTRLWHPSALMFRNIFANSGDKYKVIAEASRMGGNHSGLINLLADCGDIFLDSTPMTIWLSVQKPGAKNYSSQNVNTLLGYYESMRKYEAYNTAFQLDYSKYVYYYYRSCRRTLLKEAINNTGRAKLFSSMISFYLSYLFDKLLRRKTRRGINP